MEFKNCRIGFSQSTIGPEGPRWAILFVWYRGRTSIAYVHLGLN